MKPLLFVAASALALSAAACAPTAKPELRTALDCPASQGDLTRTGRAADGKTCTYRSSEGAEVNLQLAPVKGDPTAALQAIEDQIAPEASRSAATAKDAADVAKDTAATASDTAQAAEEAAEDAGHSAGVSVSVGGKNDKSGHKVVSGDGETTQVDLPGIHISARDDDAKVRIGGIRINANGDDATIHIIRDVRLRGEALSRQKRGIRATFFSTNDAAPDGYRFVGYEASGPKTGPLTVAIVKAKGAIDHGDDILHDVQRLVRRNGGA